MAYTGAVVCPAAAVYVGVVVYAAFVHCHYPLHGETVAYVGDHGPPGVQ